MLIAPVRYFIVQSLLTIVTFLTVGVVVAQENLNLTDKELARESVLPVIEGAQAIRNRNVSKGRAFTFYPFGGLVLNNPFFFSLGPGGTLGYHFNEFHSLNLLGAYFFNTSTQYATDIANDRELQGDDNQYLRDIRNFPKAKMLALAIYEMSPLYGKMSFAKNVVLNIDFLFSAGGGTIIFDAGSPLPAFTVGMGQRLYFGKRWGIRLDIMALMYLGPNYLDANITQAIATNEPYILDHFKRQLTFHFLCSAGLVFLL